eukprot:TRINITY_DN17673_c0_g2_i1.p1 TRINITY_DN17673_c0_g2~~TRINITY_DN17673_c0_g2_i1.p1  ORF type:complete len:432 (+),score=97.78 TRINITY_DN17673_c0_g2_i1:79-1296(+)
MASTNKGGKQSSSSSELAEMLRNSRWPGQPPKEIPKTPEDVIRTLMAVAPEAGRPPPEVVGLALQASGIPITDYNLSKALAEAAGPGTVPPKRADIEVARNAASVYNPNDTAKSLQSAQLASLGCNSGYVQATGGLMPSPVLKPKDIKYNGSSVPAVTYNNGIAQMGEYEKKMRSANTLLEQMRRGRIVPSASQKKEQDSKEAAQKGKEQVQTVAKKGSNKASTSADLPDPEAVVRTLMLLSPDSGRPPPDVVGAALKASGVGNSDQSVIRALREALGREPRNDEVGIAKLAAEAFTPAQVGGAIEPSGSSGGGSSSSSKGSKVSKSSQPVPAPAEPSPEDIIQTLLRAAPGLGQPPPEVVGMALRQAGGRINEENVIRALKAAGDSIPSQRSVRVAMASAEDTE